MRYFTRYNVLLMLGILMPIFVITSLIMTYSVNVPVTDQYEMVPLFQKLDKGTLSFFDLWAQHNEHRVLFPTTYELFLAKLTHWNIKAEIFSSYLIALAGFGAILAMIRRTKYLPHTAAVMAAGASFLFFSPVQWENWLWGWQVEWFMCSTAIVWSLYHLSKVKKDSYKNLILAVGFGIFASYCLASGPLIWPVGLLALLMVKAGKKHYAIWSAFGAVATGAYYLGYKNPPGAQSKRLFLHQPLHFVQDFLVYLGRPISGNPRAALIVGSLALMVFLTCVVVLYQNRRLVSKYSPWLALATYTILVGLVTTVGRIGFGVAGFLSSRYTTFSLLFIIATFALAIGLLGEKKLSFRNPLKEAHVLAGAAILLALAVLSSYHNGLRGLQARSDLYRYIKSCSQQSVPDHACLYEIYFPSTQTALDRLNYLKQKHYGGY